MNHLLRALTLFVAIILLQTVAVTAGNQGAQPALNSDLSRNPVNLTAKNSPVDWNVEEGKQKVEVNGRKYLVEAALRADFALINAFMADYLGNLAYVLTSRNFNPVMAMAADTVIVTAEHIVPVGVISPDSVITPGPLVDYLVSNG